MNSGNTLKRKVAGPLTLPQPTQELPSNTLYLPYLFDVAKIPPRQKDLSQVSFSLKYFYGYDHCII